MVTAETATVYRAAGRRWLTKQGACRAAAKAKIRTRCECERGDHITPPCSCFYHADLERYEKIIRRLARMYAPAEVDA